MGDGIDLSAMLTLLIYFVIILLVFSVVYWVLQQLALPQPIRMVAVVVMALIAVIFLLSLVGGLGPLPRLR